VNQISDINIRICGMAGQGVQTSGELLLETFAAMGIEIFATQSYMSRVRGGLNSFDVRISEKKLFSRRQDADIVVALTVAALDAQLNQPDQLAPESLIIFEDSLPTPAAAENLTPALIGLPLAETSKKESGSPLAANTVAVGAVMGLLGYPLEALEEQITARFQGRDEKVVSGSINSARAGRDLFGDRQLKQSPPQPAACQLIPLSGTEAVGHSAATSGIRFVASYPMTPSTGVFTWLAGAADDYGILVEQAEDEIAAINMICGAAYAGVPAMTTTSGGGFALMCEGISLAGMLELPVLILNSQRPGPATGLPTRTAQEDLHFAAAAGHGEFARAIYAPGTPEQAALITRQALITAHKWQSPVILLIDQYLADLKVSCPADSHSNLFSGEVIDRCIETAPAEDYQRYQVTASGVSPRAIPGGKVLVISDSDEHTPDGHLTEDLSAHLEQTDKRLRKVAGISSEALAPEYLGPDDAQQLLVCWGSTYGPCREAVELLNNQGRSSAMLHYSQVYPLNPDVFAEYAARARTVTVVEGNATGQFALLLRESGVTSQLHNLLRYDGLPFTGTEIAARIR
jgi:2-oxoglutarate/2-oxoacid ferredoxin oxidoreductase subunit alpha